MLTYTGYCVGTENVFRMYSEAIEQRLANSDYHCTKVVSLKERIWSFGNQNVYWRDTMYELCYLITKMFAIFALLFSIVFASGKQFYS